MERDESIAKIVEIAGGYRKGEIATFNEGHVERWIEQFPVSGVHKNVILKEVAHMLRNFYISRDVAKENLIKMFKFMKDKSAAGCSTFDVNFLRTQEKKDENGNPIIKSQTEILMIADEILKEVRSGIGTKKCGGSNIYLYLDDCIYSGSKWRYDILGSSQLSQAKKGFKLISYHFGMYDGGYKYSRSIIDEHLKKNDAIIKPFRMKLYNNDRFGNKQLDILWPKYVVGNKQIDIFVNNSNAVCDYKKWKKRPLFRTNQIVSSEIFTSMENQHVVEQAFLAVGAKLFCAARGPAESIRPMGFEVIATIGFGTPIITWRNIANNCPLALWYGNPAYGSNHPLGLWYPLFQRKIN